MEKYIGKYSVKDFLYLILGAFIYSIGTFTISVSRPTGRFVTWFNISATPTAPPGAIFAVSIKLCVPIL